MREKSPAAARVLDVLSYISTRRDPVGAQTIATALGLPRSSVYQLLNALVSRGFVSHFPEERAYGLALGAYELSQAYNRQAPLARAARPILDRLVDEVGESGHVAMLRGHDVVYLVEERAPHRPSLVTDVGVRLPAHLTASGRAMLAHLSPSQLRAVYAAGDGREALLQKGAAAGPENLAQLRALLAGDRDRGYAREDGEVTPGFASVACAVTDRIGMPLASLAITFVEHRHDEAARRAIAARVAAAAAELKKRLG